MQGPTHFGPFFRPWSPIGPNRYSQRLDPWPQPFLLVALISHQCVESKFCESEQAPKVKNKNIPKWAEGLYHSSGLMSEVLVYHDEEASNTRSGSMRPRDQSGDVQMRHRVLCLPHRG